MKTSALPSFRAIERVQTGWRIRRDLKRWIDIEAAKRQLVPARVIEELILGMQEHADAKS